MRFIARFFLFVNLLRTNALKFCVNCRYFIPSPNNYNVNGKCLFYPMVFEKTNINDYLVTGKKEPFERDHYYCTTCRGFESLCGYDGKHWETPSWESPTDNAETAKP